MADHSLTDNFRALDNTAPSAASQLQSDASHHLLLDTFKPAESKSITANLQSLVGDAVATTAGATVGAAGGTAASGALAVLSGMTMPFLTRKSIPESVDIGFKYGMETITPRWAAIGGLSALAAYELYEHTLGKPAQKPSDKR